MVLYFLYGPHLGKTPDLPRHLEEIVSFITKKSEFKFNSNMPCQTCFSICNNSYKFFNLSSCDVTLERAGTVDRIRRTE